MRTKSIANLLFALSVFGFANLAHAQASPAAYIAKPPVLNEVAPPLIMFALSNDHQLYIKAYTDYTDLDKDGTVDTTYNNNFDYYGYFDSDFCYSYDSTAGNFTPAQQTSGHNCSGVTAGRWSGNFLNWLSMTRIDIVRRVLYGGARYSDPVTGNVVLERSLLPADVHSYAKVYSGSDINRYTPYSSTTTFCNVTPATEGLSKDLSTTVNPPKILAADGSYPAWASGEVRQCGLNTDGSPAALLSDFNARVEVCVPNKDASNTNRCKQYANGSYKPVGLLQKYGESRELRFGLVSGSYEKNISGGVLRREIGYVAGNTGAAASKNEIDLSTGQFINQTAGTPGIINALNRFRISQYDYANNRYNDCASPGISVADFKAGNRCRDWGNPLAEIYAEALRYISGNAAATPSFAADDTNYIPGLASVNTWTDPYGANERCANCAIIVLSTGLNSFDADEFASGIPGLVNAAAMDAKTDSVGTQEGISGQYFIGSNGSVNNGQCTAKTVSSLSSAKGLCPELPQQEGSYRIAGLAYNARTTDLRPDATNPGLTGKQTAQTYAIQLAETVPQFSIPLATGTIQFMPACVAQDGTNPERQCSIVDVNIVSPLTSTSGAIQVTWEDSSWGNDYDLDAAQQINYCVASACVPALSAGQIKLTITAVRKVAGHTIKFGYTLAGTTNDGQHILMTLPDDNFTSPLDANAPAPIRTTYTVGGSTAGVIKNPLWFAAKYGGFNDIDGDGTPKYNNSTSDKREWDVRDANGNYVAGGDGNPDNFFAISNPGTLEQRLGSILQNISERITSGTAAAVVANSGAGLGAIYQAYYNPRFVDDDGREVTWGGVLHGLFVDELGRLREDRGTKGVMEATTTDYVVQLFVDYTERIPTVKYYRYTDLDENNDIGTDLQQVSGGPWKLSNISSIWNARDILAQISDANIVQQRAVDAATGKFAGSDNRRYIFTFLDRLQAGAVNRTVDTGEVTAFTSANFQNGATNGNYRYLGLDDPARAPDIVNFIRGLDGISGYRNRTVDFSEDGTDNPKTWRLGDMIHSSPAVVAAPNERYDIDFGDETYATFKQQYQRRRQMIYVGGNDGMLHAFNGGIWDTATKSYKTQAWDAATQSFTGTSHELGLEMWAYVPMNLLPHLQWLVDPSYAHVYYIDGAPMTFDANIFTDDAVHPGGWGTVLVVGMRLGGGAFAVDLDGDGIKETTTRSSYMIFDVTDPESPPTLIAELTDADLGFTTSMPALVKRRVASTAGSFSSPSDNKWYLVFGSGPNVLSTATSTRAAKVYAYDLVGRSMVQPGAAISASNSFFGDFIVADWDADYSDDVVYVGTVQGTEASPTGDVKRIVLNNQNTNFGLAGTPTINTLMGINKPVVAKPTLQRNLITGERWVLFGTGRLFTTGDNTSTTQQTLYGVLEPSTPFTATISESSLVNVTNILVTAAGNVFNGATTPPSALTINSSSVSTFQQLQEAIRNSGGWKRDLAVGNSLPSERNISEGLMIGSSWVFTSYRPSGDACDATGNGWLYAVNFGTGTASPFNALDSSSSVVIGGITEQVVGASLSLGKGLPSSPRAINNKVFVGTSQGTILPNKVNVDPGKSGRQSWRYVEIPF